LLPVEFERLKKKGGAAEGKTRKRKRRTRCGTQKEPTVVVLEPAGWFARLQDHPGHRADDLFTWLKDNKYSYSGDEATSTTTSRRMALHGHEDHTMQMKRNKEELSTRSYADAFPVQ